MIKVLFSVLLIAKAVFSLETGHDQIVDSSSTTTQRADWTANALTQGKNVSLSEMLTNLNIAMKERDALKTTLLNESAASTNIPNRAKKTLGFLGKVAGNSFKHLGTSLLITLMFSYQIDPLTSALVMFSMIQSQRGAL